MTATKIARQSMEPHPHHDDHFFRALERALAVRYSREILRRPRRQALAHREPNGLLKPRIDLLDDPRSACVTCQVEIPGMKKEDLSLLVQNGNLTVSGERRPTFDTSESAMKFAVREVKYGKFRREVAIPPDLRPTEISASMADGMLTITWPRVSAETEMPQRVEVLEE